MPEKQFLHSTAKRSDIPETALEKRLKVMDSAAFALCMDNNIPIVVFDFFDPKAFEGVVLGKTVGTLVSDH